MMIKIKCSNCGEYFYKDKSEYDRQIRKGKSNFYCSPKCVAIGTHVGKSNPMITKICPYCGKLFLTKTGSKEATFCSRECASSGSVTDKRRIRAKEISKNNFTYGISHTQKILKTREAWKYKEIKEILDKYNEKYEFEYIIEDFIYDLALLNRKIIFEFDGPDHKYLDETNKTKVANKNNWLLIRQKVMPNTVIDPTFVELVLKDRPFSIKEYDLIS